MTYPRRTRTTTMAAPGCHERVTMLAALSLASFLVVFDDSAVSVALPSLQRELRLDVNGLGWTLNAYTVGLAAVLLMAGRLADRFGPHRVLLAGVALFTVASVPAGLAENGSVLIAARAVQGVGAGFVAPASLAAISVLYPAARRGLAIGVWAGISAIGLGGGPLLGAVIVEYLGWSYLFLINVPLGVLLAVVVLWSAPVATPARGKRGRLDVEGAAAAGSTLLLVLLALSRGNADGWLSPSVVALALGALGSAVMFGVIERRAVDPLAPLDAVRSRQLVGSMAVGLLSTAAMCSLFFFVSLYLQSTVGYGVLETGAAFLPMTVAVALGSPLAGAAGRRLSARTLASAGMTLVALAMVVLMRIDDDLGTRGLVLSLAIAGLGVALTATPVTAVALAELPQDSQGLAGALVTTARTVGLALGVALMGAIVGDARGDALTARLSVGFALNAAVAAAGAILALWLLRPARRRRRDSEATRLVERPAESGG